MMKKTKLADFSIWEQEPVMNDFSVKSFKLLHIERKDSRHIVINTDVYLPVGYLFMFCCSTDFYVVSKEIGDRKYVVVKKGYDEITESDYEEIEGSKGGFRLDKYLSICKSC